MLGFMLFKGQDDKPDFFCGYQLVNNQMKPQFESDSRLQDSKAPTKPVLYRLKLDAIDTWKELQTQGIKVELLEIKAGYCQYQI